MTRPPPDPKPATQSCLAVGCLPLAILILLPVLFVPYWPYSAAWGWWPLVVVLLVLAALAVPRWPHSRGYGFYPAAFLGALAVVLLLLALFGAI